MDSLFLKYKKLIFFLSFSENLPLSPLSQFISFYDAAYCFSLSQKLVIVYLSNSFFISFLKPQYLFVSFSNNFSFVLSFHYFSNILRLFYSSRIFSLFAFPYSNSDFFSLKTLSLCLEGFSFFSFYS